EGGHDQPPQRRAPVPRHRAVVPLRPARRLDAVPLVRLRFLRLGDLGGPHPRRPPRGGALRGEPLAPRIPPAAGRPPRDRPEPDSVGVPPAHRRRPGRAGGRRAEPAPGHLRRRGPGIAGPATMVRASWRSESAISEHVWYYRDDRTRHLSA